MDSALDDSYLVHMTLLFELSKPEDLDTSMTKRKQV